MKKSVDLLGLGIAPVDFFVSVDRHPPAGRKIDGLPGSALIAGGGPVPTALCTFSRFGGSASLITAFGDDQWGFFARLELDRFGVDHRPCLIRKRCPSALAFAWIERPSGNRTIVLDMPGRLFIAPRDLRLSSLPRPKLIHLDGRHLTACRKLARWGKSVGARIMLDVGSVRNPVDDLFSYLDFLVCADQYALAYFSTRSLTKAAAGFKALGLPEVVITAGIRGSYGIDSEGRSHHQPAFRVKTVDVTGAGDVYHGAYLYGTLREWDIETKMRLASAAAALKCRQPGARRGIPTLRQTLAFMRKGRLYHD